VPAEPTESSDPPALLDLGDFDAVGVASDLVDTVRQRAITADRDIAATVSAPDGWHRVVVTGRRSGHVVLALRFSELTNSRWHNIERALRERGGWDPDDDAEGVTRRYPPGTEATTVAFELLAVLTLAGAPADTRTVTVSGGN
jgi:hypothetical protein